MKQETIRDWKNKWIETNGKTDKLEVVIADSKLDCFAQYVYEGSFKNIPEKLLNRQVIQNAKIIDSTVQERIGAYSLTI